MRKTITLLVAVAFFCGGLSTATGQEDSKTVRMSVEVVENIKRRAEAGEPFMQWTLGAMYMRGDQTGIIKNDEKAFHWFLKAAEQGLVGAQASVALAYLERHDEEDMKEAYAWCLVAYSNGNEISGELYYAAAKNLKPKTRKEIQTRAEEIQREIEKNKKAKKAKKESEEKKAKEDAKTKEDE